MYKLPLRRTKATGALASMLRRHAAKIAKGLEERMSAVLEEGEEMPDVAHFVDLLGRMLEHENERLDSASEARVKGRSKVIQARRHLREEAEPELRSRVIWVRDQMRNAYGAKEANRLLDHEGRTPRGLEDLEEMAWCMVSRLRIIEPPKAMPGSPADPKEWSDYLRPALAEFSRTMKELGRSSEARVELVDLNKQAVAAFDRTFSRVLRLGELLFELAGFEDVARGLREHLRERAGRPAEQVKAGPPRVA